jgi:transposase-like protein
MALEEIYPGTRHQRCWMHKAGNGLDKVPKPVQGAMKIDLREIRRPHTCRRPSGSRCRVA